MNQKSFVQLSHDECLTAGACVLAMIQLVESGRVKSVTDKDFATMQTLVIKFATGANYAEKAMVHNITADAEAIAQGFNNDAERIMKMRPELAHDQPDGTVWIDEPECPGCSNPTCPGSIRKAAQEQAQQSTYNG